MKCPRCGMVFEPKRSQRKKAAEQHIMHQDQTMEQERQQMLHERQKEEEESSMREASEIEQTVNETAFDNWLNSLPNYIEACKQKVDLKAQAEDSEKLEDYEEEETSHRRAYWFRVRKILYHPLGTKPAHKDAIDRLDEILENHRVVSSPDISHY